MNNVAIPKVLKQNPDRPKVRLPKGDRINSSKEGAFN
jgi:hypothetical protein